MSTLARNIADEEGHSASRWTAKVLAAIARLPLPEAPLNAAADVAPILPGHDLWDVWPLQLPDDLNPGSREWSGAAVYDADSDRVTAFSPPPAGAGRMDASSNNGCFKPAVSSTLPECCRA